MPLNYSPDAEWLETDGFGGFASGTVGGIRSRRYHGLLLTATNPPTGRVMLVNGFDAWIETTAGVEALTAQRYAPGVTHPPNAIEPESFTVDPWPTWVYRLSDGSAIRHELFVPHGQSAVALSWQWFAASKTRRSKVPAPAKLHVRPLLSGRDYHALHHENAALRSEPHECEGTLAWRLYGTVPEIVCRSNADYRHEPVWYRNFLYEQERQRGLDYLEDLASPGVLTWDLSKSDAVWVIAAGEQGSNSIQASSPARLLARWRSAEKRRRARFATPLHRAADAYLVRRGRGRTIVAGYPWFTDWGRDTFIALRGLCLATGRFEDAGAILFEWSGAVSDGMLPNRFPDRGETPDYNSVDASLWFIIAVHDFLMAVRERRARASRHRRNALENAARSILTGYEAGTRHGIRCDADGLLAAGEPGLQLTWMDAKIGDWVVTPRTGKPVEIQALWLNALWSAKHLAPHWADLFERGRESFRRRFWNASEECLYDVVDCDHQPGTVDPRFRPNQIFAVGGLPLVLLDDSRARQVVDAVERRLWTPLGLRSLSPDDPEYVPHYRGGPRERDAAYHQGTVWPWLIGPFAEAWVRVRGSTPPVCHDARERFIKPLLRHLNEAGIGHISEVADADAPHRPDGCPFQAWSLGELLRLEFNVLAGQPSAISPRPVASRRSRPDCTV